MLAEAGVCLVSAGSAHEPRTKLALVSKQSPRAWRPAEPAASLDELVHRLVSDDGKTAEAVTTPALPLKA